MHEKGPPSPRLKIGVLCNKCGQASHHVTLCDVRIAQQVPPVAEFQFSPNGESVPLASVLRTCV